MSKFEVGDRVRIKSWDRMVEEYTEEASGITLPVSRFDNAMKPLCGLTATIKDIDGDLVKLKNWSDGDEHTWTFTIYMIERVYTITDSKWFESPTSSSFELEDEWERLIKTGMVARRPDLGDDVEKWFQGQSTVVNTDEDFLDAFRYALADFKTIDKYIKKEEEKEMNKVLNLWFERKQEKIIKKYAEMEQDFINNHYSVVKSYNELVEQFEKDLDDLYKFDKVNEQFVLEEISDKNTIKYDIDFDKLSCEFTDKHIKEKQGELKELTKIREEVEAQLSLSNELKHQQEVLIQYNIIDKKTKKIVE